MLLADENVWHRPLSRHLLESVLELSTVIDLIKLHDKELGSHLPEQAFRSRAVGAVRLREDSNGVAVDDTLCLCLCGGHGGGGGSGACEGGEQTAKVGSYDCGGVGVVESVSMTIAILN